MFFMKIQKLLIFCFIILSLSIIGLMISCTDSDDDDNNNNDYSQANWDTWTVTGTRRALRDDVPGSVSEVSIFASKNEWEGFQIFVRSSETINGLTLETEDLHGPNGSILQGSEAYLYRFHHLHIEKGTWKNENFTAGWYPDPLIPFYHPITKEPLNGERFSAVPFDLPPHETHGFFVDLFIPPGTPAGLYQGTYRIRSNENRVAEIPVAITVWDFELPVIKTLKTCFMTPERQLRHAAWMQGIEYPPEYWTRVSEQVSELISRHGITATKELYSVWTQMGSNGSYDLPDYQINAIKNFIETYNVNNVEIPFWGCPTVKDILGVNDINSFDPSQLTEARKNKLITYLRSWDQNINRAQPDPNIIFFIYLCDEPNTKPAYQYVKTVGSLIRSLGLQYIKVLVVEQPQSDFPNWGNLYGAVDIWVPCFPVFDPGSAAQRQAQGEIIWTYTALTYSGYPHWHTDARIIDYRLPSWISWLYDIKGLLYWSMAYWFEVDDPWTEPNTYSNGGPYTFNGEGVLVYPAEDVGYDGIVPSLRLKVLRDSIEDYEYLTLLDQRGLSNEAEDIVKSVATSFSQYNTSPELYDSARQQLAGLLN